MLSDKIKELRKANFLSQGQFAAKIGVTQGAVSQWEHDVTKPNYIQLQAIAETFEVTIDSLLSEEDGIQPVKPITPSDDERAWAIRERLRRDPSYRLLFDAADNASPEHLKAAAAMLKALEPNEEE